MSNPSSQPIFYQERSLKESCSKLNSLVSVAIFHLDEHFLSCHQNWFGNLACSPPLNLRFHSLQFGNCPFLRRGRS